MTKTRIITTAEGKFLSLSDLVTGVNDEQLMLECLAMVKVGHDKQRHPAEFMGRAIAYYLAAMSGDMERMDGGPIKLKTHPKTP